MRACGLRCCSGAVRRSGAADRSAAGVALFDGKTLNGWKQLGGAADYQVIDGAIVGATRPGVPNSFLVTQQDFADFILEFDVRQDVGPANSGVQFRSHSTPEFENGRVHGYQADIDPSPRQWSGHIYEEAQRGWFYTGEMNPPSKALYKFGAWNHYRIEAIGPRLRVWVNDGAVADVIDAGSSVGDSSACRCIRSTNPRKPAAPPAGRISRSGPATSSHGPRWASSSATTCPTTCTPTKRPRAGACCGTARPRRAGAARRHAGFPAKGWSLANGELAVLAQGRRRRHHDRRGIRRVRAAAGVQGVRRRQQRHLLSTDLAARSGQRRAARARVPDPRRRAPPGREARYGTAIARWPRSTTCCRAPS